MDHTGDIGRGNELLVGRNGDSVQPIFELSAATCSERRDFVTVDDLADSLASPVGDAIYDALLLSDLDDVFHQVVEFIAIF